MPQPLYDVVLDSPLFVHHQSMVVPFDRDSAIVSHENRELFHAAVSQSLRKLGSAYEEAYDRTVSTLNEQLGEHFCEPRQRKHAPPRLSKRRPTQTLLVRTPCRARAGEYEPPCETCLPRNVRLTKQVRRLQALLRSLQKQQHVPSTQDFREWKAIRNMKGFQKSFLEWAFEEKLCDLWYSSSLPPLVWLQEFYASLKAYTDAHIRHEAKIRSKQFQHKIQLDALQFGASFAHALVRPSKPENPQSFELNTCYAANRVRLSCKSSTLCSIADSSSLNEHFPVTLNGHECKLVKHD